MKLALPLVLTLCMVGIGCGNGSSSHHGGGTDSGTTPTAGTNGAPAPYPSIQPNSEVQGDTNFASLLRAHPRGQAKSIPWAGSWFPYAQNGIASAANSYDHAHGTKATSWELSNHGAGLPGLQSWWGHCNGWAAAAVLYKEPRSAVSADGVTLSVSDQKALLTEVAMEVNGTFFGQRDETDDASSPSYQDVYPNQFFAVLTNLTGNGRPLIVDRYAGSQVWNQPVAGYEHAPVTRDDDLGPTRLGDMTVYRVQVTTRLWWARDDVDGGHISDAFTFVENSSYESRTYRYAVELDAPPRFNAAGELESSGKLVLAREGNTIYGGRWLGNDLDPANAHPDYLWFPRSLAPSSGFSNPSIDAAWLESKFAVRADAP